jgi:hypothetical protein
MNDSDLLQMFGPMFCIMGVSLIPLSLVFMLKMFKLKERELELELKSRDELRLAKQEALEARLVANEQAVRTIVDALLAQRSGALAGHEPQQEALQAFSPVRLPKG